MAVVVGPEDDRAYRHVTLGNRLQVLLVSDTDTDTAAASIDVHVGHFADPDHVPGIAHFLEHMLFLGTRKYPDINSYEAFLSAHGGRSNAFTAAEHTNYYFDVNKEFLKEALDRFAQFFICPLLNSEATDRELNAIDSENAKNLQSDPWRQYQLLKSSARDGHPFGKFGTGNKKTLFDDPAEKNLNVRQELLDFHQKYYSANIMKLAVIGKESLDELEQWVTEIFSPIVDKNVEIPKYEENPIPPSSLGKVVKIVPVKDLVTLSVLWQWPSLTKFYDCKPASILAHCIGHEGKGSILSLLKKKGWAHQLSAGMGENTTCFSMFLVSVDLTEAGLENVNEVLHLIYQYISVLKNTSLEKWNEIYDEVSAVGEMSFRFKSKENPFSYCSSLTKYMQNYKVEDILCGPWLYKKFDRELLLSHLNLLVPENSRVEITSKSFKGKCNLSEKWYKTEHSVDELDSNLLKLLRNPVVDENIAIPEKNPFIATDFTLKKRNEENSKYAPVMVHDNELLKIWYKHDSVFKKPKGNCLIVLTSPSFSSSPYATVMSNLFKRLVEESLTEYAYFAEVAGLVYSLDVNSVGLHLFVKGYNQKLDHLLKCVIEAIVNFKCDLNTFSVIKEQLVRHYKNFYMDQPYQHCLQFHDLLLHYNRFHNDELVEAINRVRIEDVIAHSQRILSQAHAEMLVHGNFVESEALQLGKIVCEGLKYTKLFPSQFPERRVVEIAPGSNNCYSVPGYNQEDLNSAILVSFQIGEETTGMRALADLLAQILSEPCYSQLRTEEQLGYIVGSGVDSQRGVVSLRIIVQSSVKPPEFLEERVDNFLAKFKEILKGMTKSDFEQYVQVLIALKLEKDKSLSQESTRHFLEISRRRYDFNRREKEVEELNRISHEDLLSFFHQHFDSGLTRRLSIHVRESKSGLNSAPKDRLGRHLISNHVEFQRTSRLYPSFV